MEDGRCNEFFFLLFEIGDEMKPVAIWDDLATLEMPV